MRAFSFASLRVPIVQAPMAGGPSTPQLAAAVSEAGGLGSLAAGYLSTSATEEAIRAARLLTDGPLGVNVFVPEAHRATDADVESYRSALQTWTAAEGIPGNVPERVDFSDDEFDSKLTMLRSVRPDVVTFTFGLPHQSAITALQTAGVSVGVTVTSQEEGTIARDHGADFLIAQGIEAGGHRAQFDQSAPPVEVDTVELVRSLKSELHIPVIAAGGVDGTETAQRLLDAGAAAVQIGTLFLTTEEAGTKPTHRAALLAVASSASAPGVGTDSCGNTVLTRVFTGRPARALVNRFTTEMDRHTVVGYPQVHFLTAGIRAAAAADPELLNLWAGTGFRGCREETAAQLMTRFSTLRSEAATDTLTGAQVDQGTRTHSSREGETD